MACLHFGVAATTTDCDLLCGAANADAFKSGRGGDDRSWPEQGVKLGRSLAEVTP